MRVSPPASQSPHEVRSLDESLPSSHAVHSLDPTAWLMRPAGQAVQLVAQGGTSTFEYRPISLVRTGGEEGGGGGGCVWRWGSGPVGARWGGRNNESVKMLRFLTQLTMTRTGRYSYRGRYPAGKRRWVLASAAGSAAASLASAAGSAAAKGALLVTATEALSAASSAAAKGAPLVRDLVQSSGSGWAAATVRPWEAGSARAGSAPEYLGMSAGFVALRVAGVWLLRRVESSPVAVAQCVKRRCDTGGATR